MVQISRSLLLSQSPPTLQVSSLEMSTLATISSSDSSPLSDVCPHPSATALVSSVTVRVKLDNRNIVHRPIVLVSAMDFYSLDFE
ncbi:hypothetical protein AYI69_g4680 [Smittium culicis]|uniref:Uncharacterized protein n=1 Tax=Smittium culicis TaxID=133412 RepID=A0A1R1YBQ1_9FUNG|nr:hypothetical protein AYI69_g4680 [Smittium culicis]